MTRLAFALSLCFFAALPMPAAVLSMEPVSLTPKALQADGPWFNSFDLQALSASAAVTDAQSDTRLPFEGLLQASAVQRQMSLVYDGHGLRPLAVQALQRSLALARAAAQQVSSSVQAQVAVAEAATRLGWIGGMSTTLANSAIAATALAAARRSAPDDPAVAAAKARNQVYAPGLLGGKPAAAAETFTGLAAAEPAGGWNAFWCAEAWKQAGKKAKAREAYREALALNPRHLLAQRQLDKMD